MGVPLGWVGRNTKRFSEHVYRLTSITTNKEAGWFLGIDDERVYRIDRAMLENLAKEKLDPIPVPKKMSVDEVAWQKWHRYVTNVVDHYCPVNTRTNSFGCGELVLLFA